MERFLQNLPYLALPILISLTLHFYGSSQDDVLCRSGTDKLEAGDSNGAERLYRQAVRINPANDRAYAQLGVSLVAQGRRREAAHEFRNALQVQPKNMQASKLLVVQHRMLGDQAATHAESVRLLQHALHADPRDATAYSSLARVWARVGASGEALEALEQAASLSPASSVVHFNHGVLQLSSGSLARAQASFEQAVELQPAFLAGHVMLALTKPRNDRGASRRLQQAVDAMGAERGDPGQAVAAVDDPYATLALTLLGQARRDSKLDRGSDDGHGDAAMLQALASRGYVVVDGVLGNETWAGLQLAAAELAPLMSLGKVGRPTATNTGENTTSRRDRVVRLSSDPAAEWRRGLSAELLRAMGHLRGLLATELHAVLLEARDPTKPPLWPREELQYACYDEGAFYAPHVDEEEGSSAGRGYSSSSDGSGASSASTAVATAGRSSDGAVRRLYTAIYYPNAGEEAWGSGGMGGALRLWPEGSYASVEVQPVGDRLVVFSSALGHEVLPVKSQSAARCAFTMWFSAVR